MKLSIIAAMGNNRVIGRANRLPWHLPADLKHFKKLTMGKSIVMGRKTYESIGRALPGRRTIVISSRENLSVPDAEVYHSLDEALRAVGNAEEVMVIGGAMLYQQVLARADCMYLTMIEHDFEGDAFFPEWDATEWREIEFQECEPDDENPYRYRFIVWGRT